MEIVQLSGIGHLLTHFWRMLYFMVKPDSWFRLTKQVKNTIERVFDMNL